MNTAGPRRIAGRLVSSGLTRLVTLFGRPGSGKTSLGDALSDRYGFLHFALGRLLRDPITLREVGISYEEMARAVASGRTIMNERLYLWIDRRIAEAGRPVVVDGYPRAANSIAPFNRLVGALPAATAVYAIHLLCPQETAHARVRARARPDDLTTKLSDRNDEYERVQRPLLDILSPNVQIITLDASAALAVVIDTAIEALGLQS